MLVTPGSERVKDSQINSKQPDVVGMEKCTP